MIEKSGVRALFHQVYWLVKDLQRFRLAFFLKMQTIASALITHF
jgi:hypothetical protein